MDSSRVRISAWKMAAWAFLLVAGTWVGSRLEAQADFRRGDSNTDGVVDIVDEVFLDRYLFAGGPPSSCFDAMDLGDGGVVQVTPALLCFLFVGCGDLPAPGSQTPGPDQTDDVVTCESYNPTAPPLLANFALGFDCPRSVFGSGNQTFDVYATLTTSEDTRAGGAEAWSISLTAEGASIKEITTAGLVVSTAKGDLELEYPNVGFRLSEAARHKDDPTRKGALSTVCLSCLGNGLPSNTLLPLGTERIARITLEATFPDSSDHVPVTLRFEDGFKGSGQPVRNVISLEGTSQSPSLGACTILLSQGGLQLPGDATQDGTLDLSDGIRLLNFLFLGTVARLPCGDGSITDPGNISLLDSTGDGVIGLSDAVRVFTFLFQGAAPPVLGTSCVPIAGCPDNSGKCKP